jgi:phage terminase small subunit
MEKEKAPDKQIQFAQEYVIDFNGKQAAIRAGYSEKTAEAQASRLLRNVKVRSEIERLLEDPIGKRNETRERVLAELEQLAYSTDDDAKRDKIRALELLLKMHGLLTDRVDVSGGLSLEVNQTVIKGEVKDHGTVDRRNQN